MVLLQGVQHGTLCWFEVEEICSAYFEIKFKKSVLVFALGLGDTWTFATISVLCFPKTLFYSLLNTV
jgi:hypothetical protein